MRAMAWLVASTVLLLAPFANKAFHVDDPLFLWTAQQIQRAPLDPYRYDVNWYGSLQPASDVIQNPPLASYFIAAVTGLAGWSEVPLHLAFLLPAAAAVLGTWVLARRLCPHPVLAGLATLVSPVFLVSASSVMCDAMMLALWTWTVALWLRGLDEGRLRWLAAAAALLAAAVLAKYYAITLVPLLLVASLVHRPRPRVGLALLALPVLVLLGYELATRALYGRGLVAGAVVYAGSAGLGARALSETLLTGLSFMGGGLLFPAAFAICGLLGKRGFALLGGAFLLLLFPAASVLGNYPNLVGTGRWGLAVQLALMAAAGVVTLLPCLDELRKGLRHRAPPGPRRDALLLGLWILGTCVFAALVNWTTNGRSILPLAPAAAIALVRALGTHPRPWRLYLSLAPVAALSLLVTWADTRLAGTARDAAQAIAARHRPAPHVLWHQGHWGFQWYAQRGGMRSLDFRASPVQPGDFVVIPENNTNLQEVPAAYGRVVDEVALAGPRLVTTISEPRGAGFYSDRWGPLPFTFGPVSPERYRVIELVQP